MAYLPVPIFFAIAFVFSMLGMGGWQLYIPMLFWTGMDINTEAIPLGTLLNLVNSASAALTYGRQGIVAWRVAPPFAEDRIVFAPLGAWLNIWLPVKPLMAFFAFFTASAVMLMLPGWRPKREEMTLRARTVLGLTAGGGLGLVAGLIGRGGGSFIVPPLDIIGLEARVAAATSVPIVTRPGLSSFASHLAITAQLQSGVWSVCVGAVLVASQLGSRLMAGRMPVEGGEAATWRRPTGRRRANLLQGCGAGKRRG